MRMYDNLEANDCWIANNHTFDIHSYDDNGNVHRLYLTAFIDAKSGVMTVWNITESPDSQSTILALRHGIIRFGLPKCIYVDNGREFLTHDIGGKGNRTHGKKSDLQPEPPTILKRRIKNGRLPCDYEFLIYGLTVNIMYRLTAVQRRVTRNFHGLTYGTKPVLKSGKHLNQR